MPSLRTLLKFLLPLLLVLLLEGLFRLGIWELIANPSSHAGTSIQLKRALVSNAFQRVDLVTLGSSRPEFGLDHEQLAADAQAQGLTYANASMPGTHWMTVGALGGWLRRQHPEVRGGIVALSIQDFTYAGNGDYELGIVTPLRSWWDASRIERSVAFDWHDADTYAIHSALFAYREDVQNLLRHPRQRRKSLRYMNRREPAAIVQENATLDGDMCAIGLRDMTACERIDNSDEPSFRKLSGQCQQLRASGGAKLDFDRIRRDGEPRDFMRKASDTIRERLRSLDWPTPPVVVLMPTTDIWKHERLATGLHDWALEILRPLIEDGTIHLIDGTDALDGDEGSDCRYFADFYHQNAAGRDAFARWLKPRLYPLLFDDDQRVDTAAEQASR